MADNGERLYPLNGVSLSGTTKSWEETLNNNFKEIDKRKLEFDALKEEVEEMPTASDATVTIQKNGADVDSFTLDQATDKVINIALAKGDVGLGNVDNVRQYSASNEPPYPVKGVTVNGTDVVNGTTKIAAVTVPTKDSDLATNDRYVRYDNATQGLTNTQKSNARTNIDAGTYSKPNGGIPASDLAESYYLASNPNGYQANVIEGVQLWGGNLSVDENKKVNIKAVLSVGASTGLRISGTPEENPVVEIASTHKLPTTTEYNALATKDYVDTAIDNLPEPMVFKGTLGTGGTITSLPSAAADNEGYTYKVITAGTYASQAAKVGDVFVSNGSAWVLIPSGDDVEDTWRAINVNGTQLKDNGITSGAINFKNGGNITVTGSGNDITLGVASGYSIPSTNQQNTWTNKQDALDAQTAYTAKGTSTKVPTITTNELGQVTAIVETDIAFPTVDISGKMDKVDPTGTGSLSLNRKSGTTVGNNSVAVGSDCTASGASSHAEGYYTTASGSYSHAEGYSTIANGSYSHAEGYKTVSDKHAQHVFGKYNIFDTENDPLSIGTGFGRYAEIVGNGTAENARSNARTLDWNGNEVLAGSSTATGFKTPSGTSSQFLKADGSIDSNTYATETYVDNAIAAIDQKTILDFTATGWTEGSDGYYTKTIATTKYPINCFNSANKVVMATLGVTKSGDAVSAITVESDTPFAGYVVAL